MKQRQITCENCGCRWMRPVQTGRIPKLCQSCRKAANQARNSNRSQVSARVCDQCGAMMTTREKRRRGSRRNYCFECAPLGYHPKKILGRTCARDGCDENLDGKSATARYCSTECGEYARGQRVVATKRECPVCRASFEATGNKRFCQRRCRSAYENAKERGTLDKLLAKPWTPPTPFDCAHCGKRCIPGENVARHAAKFCGKDCKKRWHRNRHRVPTRVKEARVRLRRALWDQRQRQWIGGECLRCGETFTAPRAASWERHYCSGTCQSAEARARRRVRKKAAFVEEVWRPVLFKRDNWICQLCGDPVDPNLKYPDPMCASVDHIVPLSAGGEHSYANTQLAHALCNSLKGDRESGSMMFAA